MSKRETSRIHPVLLGLVVCVAIAACGSEPRPATNTATPEKPGAASEEVSGAVQVLNAYERVRSELATDRIDATTESSSLLEDAARTAAAAGGASQAQLQHVAASAKTLRDMPKSDANEVRKAFGDVSAAVVSLAVAMPSLQVGRHIFECPMAQGYKKWIQASEPISNPYMGAQMLECGTKAGWQ